MRWMLPALLALISLPSASKAASDPEKWWIRCDGPFNLCGFVERESEEERIPKQFEVAKGFSDGLAAVRVDGRYGYIDPAGKVVIAPQFEAAGPFTGEYAEVRVGGRSGAIDRSGRIVVPAQFDRLIPFAGASFVAKPLPPGQDRSSEPPRMDGEVWLEGLRQSLLRVGGGLYHLSRGWLTSKDLQFAYFDDPARGLIWAGRGSGYRDTLWGLMKADGTWQVEPRYDHVQQLMETHAVVALGGERGAVDRDGTLVVPLETRGLSYWRGGYGLASQGGLNKGIIKADGSLLGGRWFEDVNIPEEGKLPRVRIGQTWHSIDADGRLLPDQLDGTLRIECESGLKVIRRGDEVEFLRPADGKSAGRFEDGYFSKRDCPGPFATKREGRWFFVMEDGKVLGGQVGFESINYFVGDYGVVKLGGKWGIIDRSGTFTVRPKFREIHAGPPGKFVVGEGKQKAWIDGRGRWIKAPVFPKPSPAQMLTCNGGLRFYSSDGLWGLQDGEGKTVIEPRYRALTCFRQGVSWAAAPGSKEWCPIGPKGERRDAMKCREVHYPMIVTHHSPESFSEDPHESSVLWARAYLDHMAGTRAEAPKWISDFDDGPPASYSVIPN